MQLKYKLTSHSLYFGLLVSMNFHANSFQLNVLLCLLSKEIYKADVVNNPYLIVWSGSGYYINVNFNLNFRFHPVLISVENMNMLSSSIYKHPKSNWLKHKQSLILGECGSQLTFFFICVQWNISVLMLHIIGGARSD